MEFLPLLMDLSLVLLEVGGSYSVLGGGLAAGLAVLGAGLGIGRIGGSAVDAMARQPQVVDDIRGTAIIMAALVEGVALFAVVVGLLTLFF